MDFLVTTDSVLDLDPQAPWLHLLRLATNTTTWHRMDAEMSINGIKTLA